MKVYALKARTDYVRSHYVKRVATDCPPRCVVVVALAVVLVLVAFSDYFLYALTIPVSPNNVQSTFNEHNTGYYAGYLSSALMVGRFVSSYFWGRFADRYGRLPVMYIGLSAIAVLSIAFGLSTSFWWAIFSR